MRMIVVPPAASRRTISCRCCVSCAPSAAVGSSITISCASRESARRISTFCCSDVRSRPADIPPGRSKPADSASAA